MNSAVKYLRKKYKKTFVEGNEKGWFLISAMVMIIFLTAVGISIAGLTTVQYQHTKGMIAEQNADLLAEAGIEQSVYELNTDNTFAGYTTPQVFFNNATQGEGTFTTSVVTNADGKSKTIYSTGNMYLTSSSSTPFLTREVKVTVVGTESSGFSVYTGPGGLILGGNSNITNSAVYVGGTLTMQGKSYIGTNTNPVDVDVGNDACPTGSSPGPSYPVVCGAGIQPISISSNAKIYGSVCATDQTSSTNIYGGNGGSGLEPGCTAPIASPQTYNRDTQIQNVKLPVQSGTNPSYVCGNGKGQNTANWTPNLELTGNVTLSGSCDVDVQGDVYITGNLSIKGSAILTVDNGLENTLPYVIVDGTISVGGNSEMLANSDGTGIEFISYESTASCSPDCSSLSGNDLYNSQQLTTIKVASSVSLPGMIFDAYWSKVELDGSGNLGAAEGQTVYLNGGGTVIFGTTLSSGTETWAITSYQPVYSP